MLFVCVCFFICDDRVVQGADEITGNRAPKWAAGGCDSFNLNVLFVFKTFDVYIKIPMKRDICFRYNYEIVIYIYMLSR